MEAFPHIHVPQELLKLLQTNKLSSVGGLGEVCVVLVPSLWPTAVPKDRRGQKDKHSLHDVVIVPISSALYNSPTITGTPKEIQFRNTKSSRDCPVADVFN